MTGGHLGLLLPFFQELCRITAYFFEMSSKVPSPSDFIESDISIYIFQIWWHN